MSTMQSSRAEYTGPVTRSRSKTSPSPPPPSTPAKKTKTNYLTAQQIQAAILHVTEPVVPSTSPQPTTQPSTVAVAPPPTSSPPSKPSTPSSPPRPSLPTKSTPPSTLSPPSNLSPPTKSSTPSTLSSPSTLFPPYTLTSPIKSTPPSTSSTPSTLSPPIKSATPSTSTPPIKSTFPPTLSTLSPLFTLFPPYTSTPPIKSATPSTSTPPIKSATPSTSTRTIKSTSPPTLSTLSPLFTLFPPYTSTPPSTSTSPSNLSPPTKSSPSSTSSTSSPPETLPPPKPAPKTSPPKVNADPAPLPPPPVSREAAAILFKIDLVRFTPQSLKSGLFKASVLPPSAPDYPIISEYITNSQAHGFKIDPVSILKISRPPHPTFIPASSLDSTTPSTGSAPALNPFTMMLWHGTRPQFVASILYQGFHCPSTGQQMFGQGVYFADRISKSAQYTHPSTYCAIPKAGDVGYLFLCEVVLGKIYNAKKPNPAYKSAPTATRYDGSTMTFDSLMCTGAQVPDREKQREIDGVTWPLGPTIQNTKFPTYSVNYNEYIVYKPVEMVDIKYLVEVKYS